MVLVIVSAQQPGALEGIEFYIGKFEASKFASLKMWATVLGQILFSLGCGFGTAITYSSFVDRKEDVYKAGIIVSVANSAFSLVCFTLQDGFSVIFELSTHKYFSSRTAWRLCCI